MPRLGRINIWDFGGQDLYHETHRLFFQTGACTWLSGIPRELSGPVHEAGEWYSEKKPSLAVLDRPDRGRRSAGRILVVRDKVDLDGPRVDQLGRNNSPDIKEAIKGGRIQFVRLSMNRSGQHRAERNALRLALGGRGGGSSTTR